MTIQPKLPIPLVAAVLLALPAFAAHAGGALPLASTAQGGAVLAPWNASRTAPTLSLAPPASTQLTQLLVGGDDCSTPIPLVGPGPFAFDTTGATTGNAGQAESLCWSAGSLAIPSDVWFCWTASSTGAFVVSTLSTTTVDTKIAVYAGCGCPSASAIGCSDDACNTPQSNAAFHAVAGQTYTIQLGLGTAAGGATGAGTLQILEDDSAGQGCQFDGGTSTFALGPQSIPVRITWMQKFGVVGTRTLVDSVSATFGIPGFPFWAPPIGTPVDVIVWEDPNDDGLPHDAVPVRQVIGAIGHLYDDVFDTYAVPPVELDGVYFVGVSLQLASLEAVIPMDASATCAPPGAAWAVGSSSGAMDYADLDGPANDLILQDMTAAFNAVFMLRAGCAQSTTRSFCGNGDPQRRPCPCTNGSDSNAGCANSANPAGALLAAEGFAQVDDVVLNATGMTGGTCVFFRTLGPSLPAGVVFGDGVTCANGTLLRLRSVAFTGSTTGTARFPAPQDTVTLSARSGTAPGSGAVMQYGCFYRNVAAAFCPPATFNTANTLEITW